MSASRTLLVRAAPGLRCPREGTRANPITDDRAVTVPNTPYYRRRIRAGELVEAQAPQAAPRKEA